MHRRLISTVAVVASVVATLIGSANAEPPSIGFPPRIELTLKGSFKPRALPKRSLAHVGFTTEAKIGTADGSHPPALREVILELDKNVAIDAAGLPVCPKHRIAVLDTFHAEKACRSAIVGEGTMDIEIESPEQSPLLPRSKVLVLNGGVKGGVTTIFLHTYLGPPVSAAVVTTIKVSKVHDGRYGTKWVATFPEIVGGDGSIMEFNLAIDRRFAYKQLSYLQAKCPDGHLNVQAISIFSDGSKVLGSFVRACTPKG